MRIIAGEFRSRVLRSFEGRGIRPMLDRVRQSLFDVLGEGASGASEVLDLYAGSGSLGLEALSRGARRATFVERCASSLSVLRENVASLRLGPDRARVVAAEALAAAARFAGEGERFDLVFLDPPYALTRPGREAEGFAETLSTGLFERIASDDATVVLHVESGSDVPPIAGFGAPRVREMGDSRIAFYARGGGRRPG